MQGFVDGSMDAIISVDAHMCIVLFNPAAAKIFGLSIEDAIGRSIEDFIPERFRGTHDSHVQTFGLHEHTSRKMGQSGQIVGLRANGEEFPAKASISQFEIDGHKVFTVFLRDVTNQVKIREALDQSSTELEETSRMLARTAAMAKIGGWELDLQTTRVTFTEEAARLHEVEHPYIPPKLSQGNEFYPPNAWPMIKAAVDAAIAFGTPYDLESPFITAKGHHIWVRVQGFPVCEGGKTIKLQGTFQDITERKRAEAELLASKVQLQSILASIPIPLFVKDAESRFLLMNKACEDQWGMRLEDLSGTDGSKYFPADQMASSLAADRKVFENGHALDFEEPFWSTALGKTRLGHSFKNPVYDENGMPRYLVCATLDVTERKLAEAGMQQAMHDKDALLKEVHHRVKNNLQVITSLLRLEAGRSLVADTKEVLGYMRGRIRTMAQLHESLYRSGTFASVDLGAYLSQVATQAFKTQELHRDSVRLTLNLGSVQSDMDQAQAAGLLLNELISNCLKHGFPEGQAGQVSVELQPTNDQDPPLMAAGACV
jgi:PAS domain S-box-containing protein